MLGGCLLKREPAVCESVRRPYVGVLDRRMLEMLGGHLWECLAGNSGSIVRLSVGALGGCLREC